MAAPSEPDILTIIDSAFKLVIFVIFIGLAVKAFLNRNMARIGGKIGRRSPCLPADPVPPGFSRVDCRKITNFGAPADASGYPNLKAYIRDAVRQPGLVHIYHVAGCKTRIEIPAGPPRYERIEPSEALALLRELPDLRLVERLHLSDEPSFLDPWWRHASGRSDIFHQGNANNLGLVVLYLPDRALGRELGTILMHEWVHLLAFKSAWAVRRFRRANANEALPALPIAPMSPRRDMLTYEDWANLGEKLLGYDETLARQTALAAPVHAMIL